MGRSKEGDTPTSHLFHEIHQTPFASVCPLYPRRPEPIEHKNTHEHNPEIDGLILEITFNTRFSSEIRNTKFSLWNTKIFHLHFSLTNALIGYDVH